MGHVRLEQCDENLLNEIARPGQQDDFPLRPVADFLRVAVEDAEEAKLNRKPEQVDEYPEEKVDLEGHLPRHAVLPQRGVDGGVATEEHVLVLLVQDHYRNRE